MKKDPFINVNGITKTPHPICPGEILNSKNAIGKFRSAEMPTPPLASPETGRKIFELFVPAIKKLLQK